VSRFYDAGDQVKLLFPLSSSLSLLAWSMEAFPQAYSDSGEAAHALDVLRWGGQYIMDSHTSAEALVGQVGDVNVDHARWGRAEDDPSPRPAFVWDSQHPASDLAASSAAALAAISVVFKAIGA
jgi:hypothetical protein